MICTKGASSIQQRRRIGSRESLTVMVARDGDNLTGIFGVRPIELISVAEILAVPVDYVTQVEEEGRICGALVNVEIQVHGVCNILLGVSAQETGIADGMKPQ